MKTDIEYPLGQAAYSYFENGLEIFHRVRYDTYRQFQPAVGNLCIAIELMLKTLIANRCLGLLFANAPLELQVKLSNSKIQENSKLTAQEQFQMKYFLLNSQELGKCISIFYTIFPKEKQGFKPYFNLLQSVRNISIHGAFPKFQRYDLDRIAYAAIKLFNLLKSESLGWFGHRSLSKNDELFFNYFDTERIERVRKAIETAKSKAEKIDYWSTFDLEDWDFFITSCPVCGCDATLTGTTELYSEKDENGMPVVQSLGFYADSLKCDECGLELLDSRELQLASVETVYDRDRDLEKWLDEKGSN